MEPNDRIIILAGGYSVKEMRVDVNGLYKFGHVIGVNDSFLHAVCDYGISMDRLWIDNRLDRAKSLGLPLYLRRSAYRVNNSGKNFPNVHLFDNDHTSDALSDHGGTLNGFNSGMCAINLAYQFKPKQIFLFGFDMTKKKKPQPYWYPAYDWPQARPEGNTGEAKYIEWSRMFFTAAAQLQAAGIKTFNVSPESQVQAFEKITYDEFLGMNK